MMNNCFQYIIGKQENILVPLKDEDEVFNFLMYSILILIHISKKKTKIFYPKTKVSCIIHSEIYDLFSCLSYIKVKLYFNRKIIFHNIFFHCC